VPLTPELSQEFQKHFAARLRIEPRCRQDDFGPGVQARTADALWFLTRQWQTGEFRGEDAGSPIKVDLGYSTQSIDRIKLGDQASDGIPPGIPLETLVEQELGQELGTLDYRERVRVGQEFERRLRDKLAGSNDPAALSPLIDALRVQSDVGFPRASQTPLHTLDRATQRFVRFMTGRVIDGEAVLAGPLTVQGSSAVNDAALEEVRQAVISWYGRVCARPDSTQPPAWQPEALDYRFEANAYPPQISDGAVPEPEQKTHLIAPDYRNGTVDWYTFAAGSDLARNWPQTAERFSPGSTTPTRVEVAGTSARWWAFEDGHTDFGAMNVAKPDLAKLLLMEMVLIYGDDWFSVPAPVALGSLARVDSLRVWNVFGEDAYIPPARKIDGLPSERFDMFTLSPMGDRTAPGISAIDGPDEEQRPLLFVPPVSGFRMESEPIDEVLFLRDEGANMVWGIEKWIPNGIGKAVDGFDAQRERLERANEVEQAGLIALIQDVEEQLEDETLAEDEQELLEKQERLAKARLAELDPYATPRPSQNEVPRYRLATSVPENWIPFIPEPRPDQPWIPAAQRSFDFLFRRAKLLRNTDHARIDTIRAQVDIDAVQAQKLKDEEFSASLAAAVARLGLPEDAFQWMVGGPELEAVPSMSRLLALNTHALLWIDEEAVPRAGLCVQLTKQRTRWVDGSTHVWLGRKVLTGRGEGASGLRFDSVHAVGAREATTNE
jgi:hypothetical protein